MSDYKEQVRASLEASWEPARLARRAFGERLRAAKHVCLFGAGQVGQAVAADLSAAGVPIAFFCDNNPSLWGTLVNGRWPCRSIEQLAAVKDEALVLVTTGYHREVCAQLAAAGVADVRVVPQLQVRSDAYWDSVELPFVLERVSSLLDALEDDESRRIAAVVARSWFLPPGSPDEFALVRTGDQYFPPDIVRLRPDEVLVDAGAFDGDTIADFLRRTGGRFDGVVAYELDRACFGRLQAFREGLPEEIRRKVQVHNLGLYDENTVIRYLPNATSSAIQTGAGEEGRVVRLADHLGPARVTFLKMDIEGAETSALRGAREIVVQQRPTLAICVYHEPAHLWEIPLAIKALVPEYRCFLRHHTDQPYETVCYAVGG